tara:strand:+ start:126 stop:308 length:183 start_codon:yes stop_codon:yes gene_type:complete
MTAIQLKLEEVRAEMQKVVEEYNALSKERENRIQRLQQLQGALAALQEVNVDTDTDSEDS